MKKKYSVLFPLPLNQTYTYIREESMDLPVGTFVQAPFGKRRLIGVIWPDPISETISSTQLKELSKTFPEIAPLTEKAIKFLEWVSKYTMSPRGSVLKMMLSAPEVFEEKTAKMGYKLHADKEKLDSLRLSESRHRVLSILKEAKAPMLQTDIAKSANVNVSVLKPLIANGIIEQVPMLDEEEHLSISTFCPVTLSEDQTKAVSHLLDQVHSDDPKPALLDGVTGSGKTEVYFEAIAKVLKEDGQALVLLPEISLSTQWLSRYKERFGVEPTLWHSDLTKAQRRKNWLAVNKGEARVVVGARSALFLPFKNLKFIVVDEEHDGSYKQEESVIYNARDMAIVRAKVEKASIVLASATPSLETIYNCDQGVYDFIHLPERHGGAVLPDIELVDLREPQQKSTVDKGGVKEPTHWIAEPLFQACQETLAQEQQVLLYLNRRGYSPLTICKACGERESCPYCTAWLVYHRGRKTLVCHHCGHTVNHHQDCVTCGSKDSLIPCGPGVERVAEEVQKRFPDATYEVISSDVMSNSRRMKQVIEDFADGKIQILIGTQMIAKGYHFPNLTLVGVIDADLGLTGADIRASEKTYQLLHQVAGRSGRETKKGKVLLQTYMPDHPVFQALITHDRDSFLQEEKQVRSFRSMPPYGRLASIIISAGDAPLVEKICKELAKKMPQFKGVEIFGPGPAQLSLIRGKHRWRFLVKTEKEISVQKVIGAWLQDFVLPNSVRLQIDVDPYSFY